MASDNYSDVFNMNTTLNSDVITLNSTATSISSCTVQTAFSGLVIASLVEQLIICVIGAISNAVCIWCLVGCRKTGKAVKVQLISIFSLLIVICVVSLPFVNYLYYTNFFCHEQTVPTRGQFIVSILNTILLQGERLSFTSMAIYRAAAVCFPRQYKKMITMKVVLWLLVGIFLFVVPPWIVFGVMQGFQLNKSGNVMRLHFKDVSSIKYKFVMALYGLYYCLPFVITFIAYAAMMVSIIRQNRRVKLRTKNQPNNMDQVAFTIRLIILNNLVLDGPHVIVHIYQDSTELAILITHMIFFLHVVFDPIIFIVMNKDYKSKVFGGICKKIPLLYNLSQQSSSHFHENGEALQENGVYRVTWRQEQLSISNKRNAVYLS